MRSGATPRHAACFLARREARARHPGHEPASVGALFEVSEEFSAHIFLDVARFLRAAPAFSVAIVDAAPAELVDIVASARRAAPELRVIAVVLDGDDRSVAALRALGVLDVAVRCAPGNRRPGVPGAGGGAAPGGAGGRRARERRERELIEVEGGLEGDPRSSCALTPDPECVEIKTVLPLLETLDARPSDDRLAVLTPFAISVALGLLIGIERQRFQAVEPASVPGGIRTFPLIAILGCGAAWLGARVGAPAFVALAAGFAALIVGTYVVTAIRGDVGMTSEVAALLTFVLGAMVYHDHALLASVLAVGATVLLSLRRPLHQLASRIEEADLYAALKLAVVTVIVLPLLPDRRFGPQPYDVFNPYKVWLLVVFIAAIGFAGYVGMKVLGPGRGIAAAGALGGVVSSTAVTLTFSGRSRETPALSRACALAIALAWATLCVRVLIEVAVVNPDLVPRLAAPVGAALAASLVAAAILYLRERAVAAVEPEEVHVRNPFSLLSAVKFGALFTAILFVAKFAQVKFASAGVIAAAALSGTVDVDAMTLASARLARTGEMSSATAVAAICVVIASNTLVKAGMAVALGSPALRRTLVPVAGATLAAGGAALFITW